MKSKQPNPKSTTTHIVALWLILAAFCLPAAQGRGSPPGPNDFSFILSGLCSFDILAQGTGKAGVISLPDGSTIFTAPASFVTQTNLSDPTKSVTMSFTGTQEQSPVQNGTFTITFRGRNGVAFGPFAPYPNTFFLLIGTFTTVVDANTGHTIQGPTGSGQMINMCTLLE